MSADYRNLPEVSHHTPRNLLVSLAVAKFGFKLLPYWPFLTK